MPMPDVIEANLGTQGDKDLEKYVWNQITALKTGLQTLHETKVKKWRKLYRGVPESENRNFPWKNASNLVVQLIGTHVDMLRARVLASIFEVMPLYVTSLVGEWDLAQKGEEQRDAIEEFITLMGLEPKELDLYRVESQAFDEAIKFGTVFVKTPWETELEHQVAGYEAGKIISSSKTTYDGPRPEKLPFESFMVTPQASTLAKAPFKCHIKKLTKMDLLERKFRGVYEEAAVEAIILNPDRSGASSGVKDKEQTTGAQTQDGFENAEWDVYECWFPYLHSNGEKYRVIYSYHYKTKTCLKKIFSWYPVNEEPFEMGRLGYADDGIYGYGFCEMLDHYQQELSTTHNQSIDNNTLLNTSILRVGRHSRLDGGFSIYPMAIIPAEEGEIEKIQLGSAAAGSIDREKLTLELARMRSGVDPGMSGAGGGSVNKKGSYSAMGTFSVMQEGNRRTNINITDMRYLHMNLGRKFLRYYAEYGVGERKNFMGAKAEYLVKALDNIKKGRINLPIRAATASVNRELEKQNDMLLTQVMARHHQGIGQILQTIQSPMIPDEIKKYLVGVIGSSSQLMTHILRNFGHDDVSRLLPESQLLKGASSNGRPQGNASQGAGENGVVQDNSPQQGAPVPVVSPAGSQGTIPVPNSPQG